MTTDTHDCWEVQIGKLQTAITEGREILKTHPQIFSLWDVIALYMNLKNAGCTAESKPIEDYLRTLPSLQLDELKLEKETLSQHGYLACSLDIHP